MRYRPDKYTFELAALIDSHRLENIVELYGFFFFNPQNQIPLGEPWLMYMYYQLSVHFLKKKYDSY